LPQKDLRLVLRNAFAPVRDDLKLGATPATGRKGLIKTRREGQGRSPSGAPDEWTISELAEQVGAL
jgi:hypothetical protein